MPKCRLKVVLSIILVIAMAAPLGAETLARENLRQQATNYLELIDQGLYNSAWDSMSSLFKSLNIQPQWHNQQQAIRTAYGPLASRHFHRISYRESYSHSPDSQYIIVQFRSSFLNRTETIETVVLDCPVSSECSIREYIIR